YLQGSEHHPDVELADSRPLGFRPRGGRLRRRRPPQGLLPGDGPPWRELEPDERPAHSYSDAELRALRHEGHSLRDGRCDGRPVGRRVLGSEFRGRDGRRQHLLRCLSRQPARWVSTRRGRGGRQPQPEYHLTRVSSDGYGDAGDAWRDLLLESNARAVYADHLGTPE